MDNIKTQQADGSSGGQSLYPVRLWDPPSPETATARIMWNFMQEVNKKYDLQLNSYKDLYSWSIENIATFWGEVWHFTGIKASESYTEVLDESVPIFPRPNFFKGAKLNFAENLLYPAPSPWPHSLAIIEVTETERKEFSWDELRNQVRLCQGGLRAIGVKEGDRIAGYVANHTNALIAMLAATSLGAIWTASSTDTGPTAVLDRLKQIEPTILFADNASFYNGRNHPVLPKVAEIAASLLTLEAVIILPSTSSMDVDLNSINLSSGSVYDYHSFISQGTPSSELNFAQLSPDHPVYILYSSGTTGAPKCIVHSALGTLIQHKKEHALHCSIWPGARLFYYTTTTWMMWHWLVSGLASGATLILYSGSPFRYRSSIPSPDPSNSSSTPTSTPDDLAMPRLISELGITHFGTSAAYLSHLEQKSLLPVATIPMPTLKAIYSTGSPLAPSTFAYVYRAFPATVNLGSITGGTDIISLFGASCPLLPVYAGEIQCLGLGMAVRVYDPDGNDITATGDEGDLVAVRPFPSQPTSFWGPDGREKYRASYFDRFEGVWHHGDFVRVNPTTGGLVMLGRSDGVLKPAGVRFGSAEIYNLVLRHFAGSVADALCVGRRRQTDVDETVVLFLKMEEGRAFDEELVKEVKACVRRELSARHVPGVVVECTEIPVTSNGKKVEGAVKQILSGFDVKTSASVANAECLDWYREWARTH